MYNFFIKEENRSGQNFYIDGTDYNHIKNVLRMKIGDEILVSHNGISSLCFIKEINEEKVVAEIITEQYQNTDLPVKITLIQGLPKSDKLELIIQKAVELGAETIIPVEMARSIVKIDKKKKDCKTARYQAIAESAAKQSKRTSIPEVKEFMTFKEAMEYSKNFDLFLIPYENKNGMKATIEALTTIKSGMNIGILIGPEGGFDEKEIEQATSVGGKTISLGKRILRTETASITAIAMVMLYSEIKL